MAQFTTAERHQLAARGLAMPGGRYPIRNTTDLENAAKDWVRTGRPLAVKAWIAKSAHRLDVPVPDALDSTSSGDETSVASK